MPLVFRNRAYGALVAIDRLDRDQFTAEHQRLLEAFAASAATAVATAQSAADERRRQALAAAEAERGRWARELHDETLQSLAALRLMLAGTRRVAGSEPFAEVINEAVEQLDSDIENLRGIIADLRPAEIDELGAGAAIQALDRPSLRRRVPSRRLGSRRRPWNGSRVPRQPRTPASLRSQPAANPRANCQMLWIGVEE